MLNLLIIVGVAVVASGIGISVGWFGRGMRNEQTTVVTKATAQPAHASKISKSSESELTPQERESKTDTLLHRLRELAENIAFDVEEHNETVSQASDRLQNEDNETNAVVNVVAEIMAANDSLHEQLAQAEQKLQDQAKLIAVHVKESRTDSLTSVANRRAFDAELAEARTEFMTQDTPVCVMMIDVDHFKQFNDQFGHNAGDEVLKQVAQSLRRTTKHDAQVFRYGGEEFAILFRNKKIDDILDFAERVRASIGMRGMEFAGDVLTVTASGGVAQIVKGENCEDTVSRADNALYQSKANGRNQTHWNDGDENHKIPEFNLSVGAEEKVESSVIQEPSTEAPAASEESVRSQPAWRTQISTHREFMQDMCRRIAAQKRNGGRDALLLLKVDGFESFKETKGFDVADIMLRATAQFLKASVRDMDHIALFDDDTFGVWLPTAELINASRIGERLRAAVSRCKVPCQDGALTFSVSVGAAELEVGDTHDTMIERCTKAMNAATQRGGNMVFHASGNSIDKFDEASQVG